MIWVARVLLAGISLFWVGALLRAVRTRRDDRWRIEPDAPGPDSPVRLSVVIPARNEAANIGPCIDTILAQDLSGVEVIVLDDGSTDGTSDVLARYADRVRVIAGGDSPLPAGWFGKPWACKRASTHATGDWLLFLDADVRLSSPHALAAALGYATRNGLGMLSGFGRLEMVDFWEKVLQPAVGGLIVAGNDLAKVNDPARNRGRVLANGQYLLFRRDAYEAIGGHEAVRHDVLDDVGLARAVVAKGFLYHLVFMRRLFSCRMYTSLGALWEGWTKNLFAGLEYRWTNVAVVCGFVGTVVLLPFALLFAGGEWALWGAMAVLAQQAVRLYLDRVFEQDARYGVLHALGGAMLVALVVHSAVRTTFGTATWKGRTLAVRDQR